ANIPGAAWSIPLPVWPLLRIDCRKGQVPTGRAQGRHGMSGLRAIHGGDRPQTAQAMLIAPPGDELDARLTDPLAPASGHTRARRANLLRATRLHAGCRPGAAGETQQRVEAMAMQI